MTTVAPGESWKRRESGPVVRPYAVTGGRTEPADGEVLDLIAVIVATSLAGGGGRGGAGGEPPRRTPEHRKIIDLARQPTTVADIASGTRLPVGVVRVLLADLIMLGAIKVVRQRLAREMPSDDLLREILNGLRAL
ncbi:MAG: multi-component regulatory system-2 [Actinomycetia bacterium]|nr:multi-component regulatory system-2 [Actinomycetes bacterium]